VHWPSSAKVGELMVRQEEQPWQSRATVLLDSRGLAHRGSGPASSLEWAISAAASVAVHLAHVGFAVRLVTDRPGADAHAWHDRSMSAVGQAGPILDELAVISDSTCTTLSDAVDAVTGQGGLVIAVLGRLGGSDLSDLSRLSPEGGKVLGIVLDTDLWGPPASRPLGRSTTPATDRNAASVAAMLGTHGWYATTAGPQEAPDAVWQRLGALVLHGGGPGAPDESVVAAAGEGAR